MSWLRRPEDPTGFDAHVRFVADLDESLQAGAAGSLGVVERWWFRTLETGVIASGFAVSSVVLRTDHGIFAFSPLEGDDTQLPVYALRSGGEWEEICFVFGNPHNGKLVREALSAIEQQAVEHGPARHAVAPQHPWPDFADITGPPGPATGHVTACHNEGPATAAELRALPPGWYGSGVRWE